MRGSFIPGQILLTLLTPTDKTGCLLKYQLLPIQLGPARRTGSEAQDFIVLTPGVPVLQQIGQDINSRQNVNIGKTSRQKYLWFISLTGVTCNAVRVGVRGAWCLSVHCKTGVRITRTTGRLMLSPSTSILYSGCFFRRKAGTTEIL